MSQRPPDILQRSVAQIWVTIVKPVIGAVWSVFSWPFRLSCSACGGKVVWRWFCIPKDQLFCTGCDRRFRFAFWQHLLALPFALIGVFVGFSLVTKLGLTFVDGLGRIQPNLWGALIMVYCFLAGPSIIRKSMKLKGIQ